MKQKALLVSVLGFALLLAALVFRNGDLALMALPFLAYLAAGLWAAPSRAQTRLVAARTLDVLGSDGTTAIAVTVTVRNESAPAASARATDAGTLSVRLADELQPGMRLVEGATARWAALDPGAEARLQYTFEAPRGGFGWRDVAVTVSDPFDLFASELVLPAAAQIQVQPATQRFRPLALRPDSTLHSPGAIPAHLGGSGTDFWGVREYHPGDPLRRLDWRLAARHPGRFFTREFEQEEAADIGLILDARARLDLRRGDDSLFERSVGATASLAEVFLRQGHRVSLLVFGDQMTTVYPGYGKVQLNRILRTLARATLGANSSRLSLEFVPLRTFSSRALLVIVSPLAPGDWPVFPRLRAHGNQGLLICPDTLAFARAGLPQDTASRLALRAARVERRLELRRIAQLRVRVVDWPVDRPLSPLVTDALRPARGGAR